MHAKVIVSWKACSRQAYSYFKEFVDKSRFDDLALLEVLWVEDKDSLRRGLASTPRYSGGPLSKD